MKKDGLRYIMRQDQRVEVTRALLDGGADCEKKSQSGDTPLSLAASPKVKGMIKDAIVKEKKYWFGWF